MAVLLLLSSSGTSEKFCACVCVRRPQQLAISLRLTGLSSPLLGWGWKQMLSSFLSRSVFLSFLFAALCNQNPQLSYGACGIVCTLESCRKQRHTYTKWLTYLMLYFEKSKQIFLWLQNKPNCWYGSVFIAVLTQCHCMRTQVHTSGNSHKLSCESGNTW